MLDPWDIFIFLKWKLKCKALNYIDQTLWFFWTYFVEATRLFEIQFFKTTEVL